METTKNESIQKGFFNQIFTSRKRAFALRMAPMVDVTFLLLIFFLVAAKWRPEENFLPFQLPVARGQDRQFGKPEPLTIQIWATQTGCQVQIGYLGTVQLEDEKIEENLAALMEQIRQCLLEQKRYVSDPIEIVCDADVKWEHLAKIYNTFFGAGLTDITFAMTE